MRRRWLVPGLAAVTILLLTGCTSAVSGAGSAGATAPAGNSAPSSRTTTASTVPDDGDPTDSTRFAPPSGGPAPATEQSAAGTGAASADLVGPNFGFIRAVDVPAGNLTFDRITWFTGPEVAEACTTDAVPAEERVDKWCDTYYFRNNNPQLRFVAVSPTATITLLQAGTPVAGTLQSLAEHVTATAGTLAPYRIVVKDGLATEVSELAIP